MSIMYRKESIVLEIDAKAHFKRVVLYSIDLSFQSQILADKIV